MGAIRRIGAWPWQLSWKTNCSRELARPGAERFEFESILWSDVLVESAGPERARDRFRKGTGFEMAARPLVWHLRLQSRAARYGGRARLELSALVYHPVIKRAHRPAGHEHEILGRLFSAIGSRTVEDAASVSREANRFPCRSRIDLTTAFLNDCGRLH